MYVAAMAASCDEEGTTWFFSSCGGILELRREIQASSSVGPGMKPSSWGEEGISAIKFLLTLSLLHLRQEESKASAHACPAAPQALLFPCLALSSAHSVFFYVHQHLYYMGFFIQVVWSILGAE